MSFRTRRLPQAGEEAASVFNQIKKQDAHRHKIKRRVIPSLTKCKLSPRRMKFTKHVPLGLLAVLGCCVCIAFLYSLNHAPPPADPPEVVNDVARLNRTAVRKVVSPKDEEEIRDAVLEAAAKGEKVSIAGKRHSMGGQTIFAGAVALDMLQFSKILALDETNKILTVQSGATWKSIQEFLNPRGLAVLSMQGPNVFTVGGSMSVNAHGWDMRHGPVGASVQWFRLLRSDGSILRCTREENAELFHLVLGGYGLLGVILDVGLRVTDNAGYVAKISKMDYSELPGFFDNQMNSNPEVELGESDLSIAPGKSLLREAIVLAYQKQQGDTRRTSELLPELHTYRDRFFFDLSRRYGWGKHLRWTLQKKLEYPATDMVRTRNNIFRSPIERIRYYSPYDTDVLQEYFIPPRNFVPFIDGLREIVEKRGINLLDATVRYIEPNDDAFLRYSREKTLSVVLYVNIKTSAAGLAESAAATRETIDLALKQEGTFYLPYVLTYNRSELAAAYPIIEEFFAAKKKYDPQEVFYSEFYAHYAH
jgi:decaprenylphospho-beta-D-ribofuranose 2-oxidase